MGWNEWPLVLFTVLAQTVVGAFWVQARVLLKSGGDEGTRKQLALGTLPLWIIMAIAFALSTFHLGMPLRGMNALIRVGQAPLSNEILTGAAFLFLGGLYWWLSFTGKANEAQRRVVLFLAVVASVAFLAAMSSFYLMPTVPTWNTPLTPVAFVLTAIIAGFLLGRERLCAAGLAQEKLLATRILWVASVAVLLSAMITIGQAASFPELASSVHSAAELVPDYGLYMGIRFALLGIVLFLWRRAESGPSPRALLVLLMVPVLVAEGIGRGLFYGLHMTVGL